MTVRGEFPMPFGGCQYAVPLNFQEMEAVLETFANNCYDSHYHNFAVQMDGGLIYTSKLGVKCINKTLGRDNE